MSSSSSDDEGLREMLRESANCEYIANLVKPSSVNKKHPEKTKRVTEHENEGENDFENFLAKRLADRLEGNIKIVNRSSMPMKSDESPGIRLFSKAPAVQELQDEVVQVAARSKRTSINVDYEELASLAAVSADWVSSRENTVHWKDSKKPRLLETKLVKSLPNGGVECVPLESKK